MNPNDLMQALISNRWYSKIPPQAGIDPQTGYPRNPTQYPNSSSPALDFLNAGRALTYEPGPRESTHVETATPWKDLPLMQKLIMKFLSEPKTDYSGVDTTTRDPTNPLPQPLNPRLQFPNLAR